MGRDLGVLVASVLGTVVLSGCGVQWSAHRLILRADGDGITLVQHAPQQGAVAVPAGETVMVIDNGDTASRHTLMLLRTGLAPTQLPAQVRRARIPSDAPDVVVAVTQSLAADKRTFLSGGGLAEEVDEDVFHVYLDPGQRYLVVDPDHLDSGYALQLVATS
jgi:hypothetical protein